MPAPHAAEFLRKQITRLNDEITFAGGSLHQAEQSVIEIRRDIEYKRALIAELETLLGGPKDARVPSTATRVLHKTD